MVCQTLLNQVWHCVCDVLSNGLICIVWFKISSVLRREFHGFLVFADEKLNDIVGSAYYVAPEVLHRSYTTEADVWSVGVIAYILLCGSRPFWARTESGIFRSVLKADPSFTEPPWPSLSMEAKDFVKRMLNKDPRKRITAAQALCEYFFQIFMESMISLPVLLLIILFCRPSLAQKSCRSKSST